MPDYEGTSQAYDLYRRRYPALLIDKIVGEVPLDQDSIVADLACGTGQVALDLAPTVKQVIAIDRDPAAIAQLTVRAATDGVDQVHATAGEAETAELPRAVDAITIGNGFHRLDRDAVCARSIDVLRPGGCLVLLWGDMPWVGDRSWQVAYAGLLERWRARLTGETFKVGWSEPAVADAEVMAAAGLRHLGKTEVLEPTSWTIESLLGSAHSTSFLNERTLGEHAAAFADDLRTTLGPLARDDRFHAELSYAIDLARAPD